MTTRATDARGFVAAVLLAGTAIAASPAAPAASDAFTGVAAAASRTIATLSGFARPGRSSVEEMDAKLVFLEARAAEDPLDFTAQNRLSAIWLETMRESGDLAYLDRAAGAARASLAAVDAPRNPGGLAALAMTELEAHRFASSLELAKAAYDIDPRSTSTLAIAGDAELELGNYDRARKIYERLAADGHSAAVLARLARLAELSGDMPKAIGLLTRACELEPDSAWYRLRRGELYFRSGRLEAAEADYTAVPDSFAKLDHLAELRGAEGRYDEAVAMYRNLIERTGRPEILQALGDLYDYRGEATEARVWHGRALAGYLESAERGEVQFLHHLSSFYADSASDPAAALRWARKDLEMRRTVQAWDALAWALYRSGDFVAAADAMGRALTLGTKDAHMLHHAGLISLKAGNIEDGRRRLLEAVAANPAYNQFHVHR